MRRLLSRTTREWLKRGRFRILVLRWVLALGGHDYQAYKDEECGVRVYSYTFE
jgi:hypothetical protein